MRVKLNIWWQLTPRIAANPMLLKQEDEEDIRKLGCRNWLTAAQDSSRWQHLLQQAPASLGFVETMAMMMMTTTT
jgi:hypothetical protein